MLLGPGGPGDTLSESLGCRVTPWPMPASVNRQRVLAASGRGGGLPAGQRAEAPAGQRETQQMGVEGGEERTALLGRGPGPGWVQSQVSGGGESGCWLGRGSRHICWALAHTPRGVSE